MWRTPRRRCVSKSVLEGNTPQPAIEMPTQNPDCPMGFACWLPMGQWVCSTRTHAHVKPQCTQVIECNRM